MYDIVVIAHFSLDIIMQSGERKPLRIGGPPLYGSISAKRLGGENVGIISKVGEDFKDDHFLFISSNGIDISGIKRCSGPTTRFMLKYEGEERNEFLMAECERIEIQDIPSKSLQSQAFVISPILPGSEVSFETLKYIAEEGKGGIYLDPSGYIRSIVPDGSGKIRLSKWKDMNDYLQYVDVLKVSKSEMKVLSGEDDLKLASKKIEALGVKIIVVTEGSKGSYIQHEGNFSHIPSISSSKVIDVTGAGDVYLSAFALEFSKTNDTIKSGVFATAAVSSKIQGPGVSALKTRTEIEELIQSFKIQNQISTL